MSTKKCLFIKVYESILGTSKEIECSSFTDNGNAIQPSEAKTNSITVFDNIATRNTTIYKIISPRDVKIIYSFYLGQTHCRVNKIDLGHLQSVGVFKQDDLNLRHICNDNVDTDTVFSDFQNICATPQKEKHRFVVIDETVNRKWGVTNRFRPNLNRFLGLKELILAKT